MGLVPFMIAKPRREGGKAGRRENWKERRKGKQEGREGKRKERETAVVS